MVLLYLPRALGSEYFGAKMPAGGSAAHNPTGQRRGGRRSRRNSWPDATHADGPGNFWSLDKSNFYIFLMRHSSLKNLTDKSNN